MPTDAHISSAWPAVSVSLGAAHTCALTRVLCAAHPPRSLQLMGNASVRAARRHFLAAGGDPATLSPMDAITHGEQQPQQSSPGTTP